MLTSRMVSCSLAQAMHLVKATRVYVMSARHDQEGAPQVGFKGWIDAPEPTELPRAQTVQHPEAPVALGSGRTWPRREPPSLEQGQAVRW